MILLVIIWMSLSIFNNESISQTPSPIVFVEKPQLSTTVLYVFTGSDWCADCKRLEKNVLSDSVFISKMVQNNIVVEIIDFPQRKKLSPEAVMHNESIAEAFDFQGIFPTIVLSQTPGHYKTLRYNNEKAAEFSDLVLNKLK